MAAVWYMLWSRDRRECLEAYHFKVKSCYLRGGLIEIIYCVDTMSKKVLDITELQIAARAFCEKESGLYRTELFGITDGKAIGTFVEHCFQEYLGQYYEFCIGSSANGLDLPSVNTDIKVTSIKQPQSSCPFKESKQKIYGLGYNLIVFVYEKVDDARLQKGCLNFLSCTFIDSSRTSDYQTTTGILNIIANNGNADDIFAFLIDHQIPADEVSLMSMAEDILSNPPKVGYLTISNALQWRLQYARVVNLSESIDGITPIIKYSERID